MVISKFFQIRSLVVLLVVLILATSAYAFAADNTVANSRAGDGTGTISGFAITNVDYTVNAPPLDPTFVSQVSFTLTPAPLNGQVYIKLNSVPGSWFSCTVAGTLATCNTSGTNVPVGTALTSLQVVAVD